MYKDIVGKLPVFRGKSDSSLDHLEEKIFTASFFEDASLVCTLAMCIHSTFYLSQVNAQIPPTSSSQREYWCVTQE